MEYVNGENLSDVIARGPVSSAEATRIGVALSQFLSAAHGFRATIDGREFWSLVHGDLKPRNVRIADDGSIKVLDFGIAKALSLSRKVTRNDFGSMPYLSPERLESTEVDAQADLWALGVILYELLSGLPPFHAPDTRRLEQEIRTGYGRRPLPATCPDGLRAIVARMLAPKAADRYASAAGVLADLELVQGGKDPQALTLGFPKTVDDEATRRTKPPAAIDPEATRRTDRAAARPETATPTVHSSSSATIPVAAKSMPPVKTRRAPSLRTVLMLVALLLVSNELIVGFRASRLAASAATRDLESMDDVWSSYDALSHRSYLRFGVLGVERTLASRVRMLSEQVIANYRSTLPTVRERQWRIAQKNLQQALVLAPRDAALRASLRYCEGHLHRIDGEAEKQRRRTAVANQQFTEAVSAFREAAELRRDWADPFLGLARTFIYGLEDIDRGADALKQAQKLGYTMGDRDTAQLADGYRAKGDSLWQTARQFADMPQEADYLQRATDAYHQAQGLYERIPGFPGVAVSLRRTQRSLGRIDERSVEKSIDRNMDESAAVPADSPDHRRPDVKPPEFKVGGSTDLLQQSSELGSPDRESRHPWR